MSMRALRLGLRRLFRGGRVERELDDEVAHLFELTTAELMRDGTSRADAERAARLQLGNPEVVKETVRDAGWEASLESLWRDVRYAIRGLRRQATFTTAAMLTLALGIGATTAMFSVVNGIMLRPLPYHDWRRLVQLWTDDVTRGLHNELTAYATIADWQQQSRSFADIAYYNVERATYATRDGRARTQYAFTSPNLLPLLGVAPALGRWLSAEDISGAHPVAVISHTLWQRQFGLKDDVIGKQLVLDEWQGKTTPPALTIVGVMPRDFYFPNRLTELWIPATMYGRWTPEVAERFPSSMRRWIGLARLKRDVSAADARADLGRVAAQLAAVHGSGPPDFPGFAVNIVPLLDSIAGPRLQLGLWMLMGAVVLVLLIACANVGNLLLARGASRQHEIAVRRALGASRGRLVRQMIVESLLLALAGGALGVLLAVGATRLLSTMAAGSLPRLDQITVDTTVLVFAAGASVLAGLLFGVVPALRATERRTAGWLRDARSLGGGPRIRVMRGALVVVQCSLAVVLLVGAGLLLRSLARVYGVDAGFDPTNVLVMRIEFSRLPRPATAPPGDTGAAVAAANLQRMRDVLAQIAALPGVESAGFVDDLFITGQGNESIVFPGRDAGAITSGELSEGMVSPDFFSTMRVALRRGRYLEPADALTKIHALWAPPGPGSSLAEKSQRAVAEPAVVNETFVRRFFGEGSDPIGERFCVDPTNRPYCYVIVGVVGDMHRQGPEQAAIPEYFGPYFPLASDRADLVVRTRGNPLAAAGSIRAAIDGAARGTLIPAAATASEAFGEFSAQRRFQTWMLALFAGLALALAAVGIYGIVHYTVTQRTREIAVRVAIGAAPASVRALVLAEGLRLPSIGVMLGLAISLGAARLMSHLMFEVAPTDLLTFALVAATLMGVAVAACYAPARRAARLEAVVALRLD